MRQNKPLYICQNTISDYYVITFCYNLKDLFKTVLKKVDFKKITFCKK